MHFDDEYDWHAPHPAVKRARRRRLLDRLLAAAALALLLGLAAWGLSGYASVWATAERDFANPERPVSP